jgi:membrane protein implicated in regulation of membrane protease activity
MTWWSWCIFGVLLLGIELFAVDAQFYLVFAGLAAIVVGLLGLTGLELPVWAQWIGFAVLSLVAMVTIRQQIYAKLMSRPLGKVNSDLDQYVVIDQELPAGKSCRIEYRGSGWTVHNVGERAIAAGDSVRIESIEGVTLRVRAPRSHH